MSGKNSPQSVINSYKKRQHMMPYLVGGLAALLVIVGIIILVSVFSKSDKPVISIFATKTPTPTLTFTPTPTVPSPTPTVTNTPTETPTVTPTPKPTGPRDYTVQEGDSCWDIAMKEEVDLDVLLAINNFTSGTCPIKPGDIIKIPGADQELPTETPLPDNLPRGTRIEYYVKTGETLASIAGKFNSTVERIMTDNNITDANAIQAGQKLIISVNIVTPTRTLQPTFTPLPGTAEPTQTVTPTP